MAAATGLVIPVEGPVEEIELDGINDLTTLQEFVGGGIEAVPLPDFIAGADAATAYINDKGKFDPDCKANMRATDFMVPGVGLRFGDYIAGSFVLVGFDGNTGDHTAALPKGVVDRARLIEREAG